MATKEQNLMPNEGEPDQKQTRTFSQENEVIESDSDSESEVDDNSLDWSLSSLSDDGFGTGADRTFDELTSWNCLMLPFFDGVLLGGVRRNLLNILMKGILFVQEMYDENWSLMETFHEKVPEKYDFLFKRGDPEDGIIFQGSAAEGLVVYRIEKTDPGTWWNGLRHARESDYDIMHVNNDMDEEPEERVLSLSQSRAPQIQMEVFLVIGGWNKEGGSHWHDTQEHPVASTGSADI